MVRTGPAGKSAREITKSMSLPYRALLPCPLPDNVVPFQMALDRLILRLAKGASVILESEATGASRPLRSALDTGALAVGEGPDAFEIPLTAMEVSALRGFVGPTESWAAAAARNDIAGMAAAAAAMHAVPEPWWLDMRVRIARDPRARRRA